jgi:DNA polymerase-3 subunit epsilon
MDKKLNKALSALKRICDDIGAGGDIHAISKSEIDAINSQFNAKLTLKKGYIKEKVNQQVKEKREKGETVNNDLKKQFFESISNKLKDVIMTITYMVDCIENERMGYFSYSDRENLEYIGFDIDGLISPAELKKKIYKVNKYFFISTWKKGRQEYSKHYYFPFMYRQLTEKELAKRKELVKKQADQKRKETLKANAELNKQRAGYRKKALEKLPLDIQKIKNGINDYLANETTQKPLFLDTETTGLGYSDEAIQLAIVDSDKNIIVNTYLKPSVRISNEAYDIHGISGFMVAYSPTLNDFIDELNALLSDRDLYIYNADFDIRILKQSNKLFNPTNLKSYCLMHQFADIYNEYSDNFWGNRWQKLTTACNYYNIELNNAHDALADVLASVDLYNAMKTTETT